MTTAVAKVNAARVGEDFHEISAALSSFDGVLREHHQLPDLTERETI